jgi:hypothetical protein
MQASKPSKEPVHQAQRGRESQRDLLIRALKSYGRPAHVSEILSRAAELNTTKKLPEKSTALLLLLQSDDQAITLGEGVFSLLEWEAARGREKRPVLPICPRAWADVTIFRDQFFESVFAGRERLADGPSAAEFVARMLDWWQIDAAVRLWVRQSVLSTYYLVGLVPYTFLNNDIPRIYCDLPALSIPDTRRHCLRTLTARLSAMIDFWSLLHSAGSARPKDLADTFALIHPYGLNDLEARLNLLTGLGAVARQSTGTYKLTPLGESCAVEWSRHPGKYSDESAEEPVPVGTDDLLDWSLW